MSEQFVLRGEIDQIHPLRDITRKRAESAGLFPRRARLSQRVACGGVSTGMVIPQER
jgi:hypothetical protein